MSPSASHAAPQPSARRIRPVWRQRLRGWWLGRLPLASQHTITRRNLYLLPTGAGCMLGVTLLVLLVASINYQLNLGFLLTFMLAGSALASVGIGYRTLLGATLHLHAPQAQFAGQALRMDLRIDNGRRRTRYAIGVRLHQDGTLSMTDVPAQAVSVVQLAAPALRRGLQPLPAVVAETRFPLGVFRMWTVFRSSEQALVYPQPEAHPPPLPLGTADAGSGSPASPRASSGEFDGVRGYRRGDPPKLVVWKKTATAMASGAGPFVVRDNQHQARQDLWLDARHCGLADREAQLSRLTAWVLAADQFGLRYGLHPGGAQPPIAADSGPAHRQACLRALALA